MEETHLQILQEDMVDDIVLRTVGYESVDVLQWIRAIPTNCTYCPRDPKAIPLPPRQVMSLATIFVEFWCSQHESSSVICLDS